MSRWPFLQDAGRSRVALKWNRRKTTRSTAGPSPHMNSDQCECIKKKIKKDIRSEMENLYQPAEPVWPQCSHTWEALCWQWVSLLTGCHGNLSRHKDHLCVRVVGGCAATQADPYTLYKARPEIPGLVKYYFSPSTLPSHWTHRAASKRRNNAAVGGLKCVNAYSMLV